MKRIRKGNDISITWSVKVSGEPHLLEDRELVLYLTAPNSVRTELTGFSVSGNLLSVSLNGHGLSVAGIYSLTLVETYGNGRRLVLDCCNAFQLVDWSCMAEEDGHSHVKLDTDVAVSVLLPVIPVVGENGHWFVDGEDTGKPAFLEAVSAYDIAVKNGFTGTEEEWLASLKGADGVPGTGVPVFDLLTTSSRRAAYSSGEDTLSDYSPCLRFRGDYPSNSWRAEIYRYQNRGNKKYKLIDSILITDCERPSGWSEGGYSTLVLPATLMRLFWRVFDPTVADASEPFNGTAYAKDSVAAAWLAKGLTGVKKYGHNGDFVSPRTRKAKYTASFGIRLRDMATGVSGGMQLFRIVLQMTTGSNGAHTWAFRMKIDTGLLL